MPQDENHHSAFRQLDHFDRAILERVQENNQQTHAEIGDAVHLSPSSVRRRLQRLRAQGIIRRDVSILDPAAAGVTVIVMVTFQQETPDRIERFRQRMRDAPEVSQCYSVAGAVDYVLVAHAANLAQYEAWSAEALMADQAIRRYDTHVVWSEVKYTTARPLAP